MSKRRLSHLELLAWRRITQTVRPIAPEPFTGEDLTDDEAVRQSKLHPTTRARQQTNHAPTSPPKTGYKSVGPASNVADRKPEKRIRRGKIEIDATLDLHGLTVVRAMTALDQFVRYHRAQHARCLLVITGKGHPSEGRIRREFRIWLENPATKIIVSGFSEAHQKHGGSGAFYVFLRKHPRQ